MSRDHGRGPGDLEDMVDLMEADAGRRAVAACATGRPLRLAVVHASTRGRKCVRWTNPEVLHGQYVNFASNDEAAHVLLEVSAVVKRPRRKRVAF